MVLCSPLHENNVAANQFFRNKDIMHSIFTFKKNIFSNTCKIKTKKLRSVMEKGIGSAWSEKQSTHRYPKGNSYVHRRRNGQHDAPSHCRWILYSNPLFQEHPSLYQKASVQKTLVK